MDNDIIFGLVVFIGLVYLILTTVKLSGTKNDAEFSTEKPVKDTDKTQ